MAIADIAIVKQVNGPFVDNGDETYTVPYQLILENTGSTDLTNPSITDNIQALMGAAFINVSNLALDTTGVIGGTAPGLGGSWNGANAANILDGTGTLAAGDYVTVTFDVTLNGRELANNSPLNNQAIGSGDGPMGSVSDDSDDGDDPNGTNPGTPGDMGTSDDPTPIEIPQIGLAKQIQGTPTILANENVLVTYRLVLANTGTVDLDNIQIEEDIESQYGSGVLIAVNSPPAITVPPSLPGSISPILATWDGGLGGSANTNVFNGTSGTLLPGDFIEVEFTLEIDPDAMGSTQPLLNQAVASGEGPDGTVVMDDSDDGTDPNSDNPGSPGDMGTTDDPTPFAIANMAAAKETVGVPMQVAPGSTNFEVTYQVVIQNTGNLNMSGIDLYDDLAAQFGPAYVSIPSAPTIVADTLSGAAVLPTINPGWMINPSQSLFNDDGQMSPGDTITLQYSVVVDSSQVSGTLLNQAEVIADNPFTRAEDGPSDLSDDGNDPTGLNTGSPGDMGTLDDPTPVVLPNGTVGVAKNSVWNDANDTVEFRFGIEHFGNVGVSGLSMTENLDAVLGAGNYTITSGPSLTFGPNTIVVNPNFDGSGDTELLDPSSTMNPGQTAEIVVSVAVDTIADPQGNGLGLYVNQVDITSEDADGNTYEDVSTNGSDPDPDGDGDPTNNTVPSNGVLTVYATVGGAKTATLAADNESVTFDFYLEHFGNTAATTVSLVEDLSAVFGAFPYSVTSVNVVSAPATLNANGMFNGSSDTELIASGSSMQPGDTAHIQVVVDIAGAGGAFENQGMITSTDIGGGTYMDETQDGTDPDPDGDGDPTNNDDPTEFSIANGEINGTVYVDLDGDGIQDPGEAGIPGVEITLTGTDIYGNPVSETVLTDADGNYSFTGLSPGDYTLTQTQPDSFIDGADTPGNLGGSAGNDVINVTLSGDGFVGEDYNFGEAGLDPSAVGKDLLISPDPAAGGGGGPVPPGSFVESDTDESAVRIEGSTLYVQGTSDDEVISIQAGIDSHMVTISQVTYRYDADEIDTIRVDAGEGNDFVEVRGSSLDDRVVLHKNHGSLRSDAYDIEFRNAPRIYAYGEGGLDHGYLVDSVGDDVFVTASTYSSMRDINNEYKNETKGFELVTGNAIMGGFDIGSIFDSPEDDLFRIMPDFARMFGGNGVDLQANKFERLDAYARSAGNDTAEMVDSLGNDSFITSKTESRMVGDGFRTRAFDFESVIADSRRGGTDSVAFYDAAGNDTFVAGLNLTTMSGKGYEIQTRSFDTYTAVSRFGDDTAEFNDVRTSDDLVGRNEEVLVTGQNRDQTATGFDTVKARSRNNQTASADIQNVDFLFETFGQWV
ncbi:MAG: SdrD B-like domain-containing protein [Planctomycetota bacterium]